MEFCRAGDRRRLSVTLDAGYVSIAPVTSRQLTNTFGLHGRKLCCVVSTIVALFLISLINLTCLLWFMHRLDWPLFDSARAKVLHYDKASHRFHFLKPVTCQEPIYTNMSTHSARIDISAENQLDLYGDQNSILFDDDQILLHSDNLYVNKRGPVDFANLQSYRFDRRVATRVHLNRLSSHCIHNQQMNITATNQLTIANVQRTQLYSKLLILETDRTNRRSVLRFNDLSEGADQGSSSKAAPRGSLRVKSATLFLDVPRFPSFNNNHRSGAGMYRLCVCNTTFLLLRSFAHQPCPRC